MDDVMWLKVIYYVEKEGENCFFKVLYYFLDNKLMKEVLYQDFQMVLGKMCLMKIIVKEVCYGNSYFVMEYSDVCLEFLFEFYFICEFIQ